MQDPQWKTYLEDLMDNTNVIRERVDVKVIFYDVWKAEQREYAQKYGIRPTPTQVFLMPMVKSSTGTKDFILKKK